MIRTFFIFYLCLVFFGCKRSNTQVQSGSSRSSVKTYTRSSDRNVNTVKMISKGGVYYVPIEINGISMDIIFDTGASSISISETEAIFLYKQGKISEKDILGKVRFQDATGNISEGTRINLKNVKIGNKTIYDVEASVVHNLEAPLLLGQSALSKFGKLTIDYNKNEIVFE